AVDYAGPPSGQVRAIPDVRTIRYYTTLGLLDRPAEMRGRTALYTTRHLTQLVAVKRLQERGRTLTEIQTELAGASDSRLAELAQLADGARSARVERRPGSSRADFWRAEPAKPAEPAVPEPPRILSEDRREAATESKDAAASTTLTEIGLADGVRLTLEGAVAADLDTVLALRRAAAPLIAELRKAGLLAT
ncbi:MAG TPA: MerR family transcriptional regulator, partial [Kofleriaceae bacterium]|nr:MerR family transcriptional regulator [Kofleriaceae bacterium]